MAHKAWADLARREKVHLAVIYGFVPLMLLLLLVATAVAGDVPAWFGLAAGLGGIVAFFASSAYVRSFRCPCCGEVFSDALIGPGKECAHCHTTRGAVRTRRDHLSRSGVQ